MGSANGGGTTREPSSQQNVHVSLAESRFLAQEEYYTQYEDANGEPFYKQFLSFQNVLPPPAGTIYPAVDQGTCSPKFMRSTMYNVPEDENLRLATKLPLAVTVRPFAPQLSSEYPVPVVDMSRLGEGTVSDPLDIGPPRCNRCRTYINPLMMHTSTGRFTCNICQFPNNSVPLEYVAMVDSSTNQRVDRDMRPELSHGVYDIIVPPYYNVGGTEKVPPVLHHVFLVDVSHQSIIKQIPVLVADAIRAAVFDYSDLDGTEAVLLSRFAIILFDKNMHFYNLAPDLDLAHHYVSGDLDDPFIPFHDGLFADPELSRIAIEDALNKLEQMCNENTLHDNEPCFSVALKTAAMCLDSVGGGKITAVLSTLPSWGPGASKLKENRSVGRNPLAEFEKSLFTPDNEYYKQLAQDFVKQNVGLDVFIVATTTVDVCNIGWLASVTGGLVKKWPGFQFERDGRSVTAHIVNSVKKCRGFQGQLKLRCSNGLQVSQYYGFPHSSNSGVAGIGLSATSPDPVIPVLDEDQAFTILLEYDGVLNTKYDCHFQAALLYTDPRGVRKVRVVNLVLAVSERLLDVFNFIDQDAVVSAIVRDTFSFVGQELTAELRRSVQQKAVEVFAQYRALNEHNHSSLAMLSSLLVFPDSLKHFPLYLLSLVKSRPIRDSSSLSIDSRLCDLYQMMFMPVERLVFKLYPALCELHSLADDECFPINESESDVGPALMRLPRYKEATSAALQAGVYVMCNGSTVFVSVHPDTNKLLLQDLFGDNVRDVNSIDPLIDELPELPTHISQQARNLINFFNEHMVGTGSIGSTGIQLVREGIDPQTFEFGENLVEDQLPSRTTNASPAYPDFLKSLHEAVKAKLEADRKSGKDPVDLSKNNETLAQRMLHF